MPANIEIVRKLALALPGVTEGVAYGTTAFHVKRKFMLRLREDGETLVVRFPKEEREALIEQNPDVFSVTAHYQNYPYVLLSLLAVNEALLRRMIEGAWRLQAPRRDVAAYDASCLNEKKPNQALRPTPISVTPPAGQEARQP